MSVTGICQVCENARAEHACQSCGQQVCSDHWNDTNDACVSCARRFEGDSTDPTDDYR